MCDAHAYIVKNGREEKLLENVDLVEFQGDEVYLVNIFGDRKVLKARLKKIDNSQGRLVFEPV